jgi:DNA-binding response OmpR family regulator
VRVLVVEDEKSLACAMGEFLSGQGHAVTCAHLLEDALRVVNDETFDAALLDINLNDESVYPLADYLIAHGTPVIFATARRRRDMPERFRADPLILKPYDVMTVLGELRAAGLRRQAPAA